MVYRIPCRHCITLPICKSLFSSYIQSQYNYLEMRYPLAGTSPLYSSLAKLSDRCIIVKTYIMDDHGGGMMSINADRGQMVYDQLTRNTKWMEKNTPLQRWEHDKRNL